MTRLMASRSTNSEPKSDRSASRFWGGNLSGKEVTMTLFSIRKSIAVRKP
jgi:hypothetical protein